MYYNQVDYTFKYSYMEINLIDRSVFVWDLMGYVRPSAALAARRPLPLHGAPPRPQRSPLPGPSADGCEQKTVTGSVKRWLLYHCLCVL